MSSLIFVIGPLLPSPWLVSLAAVASLAASVGAGFFFLARVFRKQRMIAGVLYYPLMVWAVAYCTL
jgi:hypothetical protein